MAPWNHVAYVVAGIATLVAAGTFLGVSLAGLSIGQHTFFGVGAHPVNFSLDVFLTFPTFFLGVTYILAVVRWWVLDKEIYLRHRPWRWIAHGIYMPLYIAALAGLVLDSAFDNLNGVATTIALAAFGFGLAYTHASNESNHARSKLTKADRDAAQPLTSELAGLTPAVEGSVTHFIIFAVLFAAFFMYGWLSTVMLTVRFWVPLIAALWYFVLFVYSVIITQFGALEDKEQGPLRDILFVVWEIVFVLFLHFSFFFF